MNGVRVVDLKSVEQSRVRTVEEDQRPGEWARHGMLWERLADPCPALDGPQGADLDEVGDCIAGLRVILAGGDEDPSVRAPGTQYFLVSESLKEASDHRPRASPVAILDHKGRAQPLRRFR